MTLSLHAAIVRAISSRKCEFQHSALRIFDVRSVKRLPTIVWYRRSSTSTCQTVRIPEGVYHLCPLPGSARPGGSFQTGLGVRMSGKSITNPRKPRYQFLSATCSILPLRSPSDLNIPPGIQA
jgi:hypothetical protein